MQKKKLAPRCQLFYTHMPGSSYGGAQLPLSPLEMGVRTKLQEHVHRLAVEIGDRNVFRYAALLESACYIEEAFQGNGWSTRRQEFDVEGKRVCNIEATVVAAPRGNHIVVVGAHYDTVLGSPGANDNASGVAAVLELARLLRHHPFVHSLRLVAFVNEEPPFFRTRLMGSCVYAHSLRQRRENAVAMLSIETIGCYSSVHGSQKYPFPFGLFYPSAGNFIGFVGNPASRSLVRHCVGTFRDHTSFPSEGLAAPAWVMGVGWSDHWAFWKEGYQAVMVTDTALFRYPHYHSAYDMPHALDFASMARVVVGLSHVAGDLVASDHQADERRSADMATRWDGTERSPHRPRQTGGR